MFTKRFFRLEPDVGTDPLAITGSSSLTSPDGLLAKLRRHDGILVATWEPHTEQGREGARSGDRAGNRQGTISNG